MKGYIYIIKNTVNEKVYIGQTSRSINDRWQQHKHAALRGDQQGIILYNAIRKYGIEKFYISQIEECDLQDIDKREIYWIKYYNSQTPNGYNVRAGGEDPGRKEVYKIDNNGNILESYGSAASAAEKNNIDLSLLTKVCRRESQHNSCGGFKWCYASNYDKDYLQQITIKSKNESIFQVNSLSGEVIKEWSSVTQAAKELNIQQSDISHCLSGRYKTAGGFQWYKKNTLQNFKPYKKERDIIQYNKDGKIIKIWSSAKEAAKFLNKNACCIRAAARGERKTAYGYIWRYKEDSDKK